MVPRLKVQKVPCEWVPEKGVAINQGNYHLFFTLSLSHGRSKAKCRGDGGAATYLYTHSARAACTERERECAAKAGTAGKTTTSDCNYEPPRRNDEFTPQITWLYRHATLSLSHSLCFSLVLCENSLYIYKRNSINLLLAIMA